MADSEVRQLADLMQTPLNGETYQTTDLVVQELATCTRINLRADFTDDAVNNAVQQVTGMSARMDANTFSRSADQTLFWLGPDERLLYANNKTPSELVAALGPLLPEGRSALVDVSDYYTVIRVAGNHARQVLASGTPFDVHPSVFTSGQCAQIRFGNATVLLSCLTDPQTYDLQVRWSYAEYLWGYLCKVSAYV